MFKMMGPTAAIVAMFGCSGNSPQVMQNESIERAVQTVRIQSNEDLNGLFLQAALKEQIAASRLAPATLEVIVGPGVYENASITLRDSSNPSNLEVIFRGAPGTPPTLKLPVQIHAARIRMENVVYADAAISSELTTFTVGESLHIEGVAWVGNTRTEEAMGSPLVSIRGGYRTGPKQITVKDSWFVGNALEGTGSLVQLHTVRPDIVSSLRFTNTVFADNQCSIVVAPEFSEAVTFEQTHVHEPHADAFLWVRNAVTKTHFDSGQLVVAGKEGVVRYRGTDPIDPDAFQPVKFTNLKPIVGAAAEGQGVPSGLAVQARSGAKPGR